MDQSNELQSLLELYKHLHLRDDPIPEPSVVQAVWQDIMASNRYQYFGFYVNETLVSS